MLAMSLLMVCLQYVVCDSSLAPEAVSAHTQELVHPYKAPEAVSAHTQEFVHPYKAPEAVSAHTQECRKRLRRQATVREN